MPDELEEQFSIRDSTMSVLERIRTTAEQRGRTELPTAEFSDALNSVGEIFVDLLLSDERRGKWWLGEDGEFLECTVRRLGDRFPRIFAPGVSTDWTWFPEEATRLADPMTGPDHVVSVKVASLRLSGTVCLEQKLRFSTRGDAVADASTYRKHLLHKSSYPQPSVGDFHFDDYFNGLLEVVKAILCRRRDDGTLTYSGTVPQVCFASTCLSPNNVVVTDKSGDARVECDYVGFLAPTINCVAFENATPDVQIVRRAKVGLWIGLDSLLESCTVDEVELAWSTAVSQLSENLHNPTWRND